MEFELGEIEKGIHGGNCGFGGEAVFACFARDIHLQKYGHDFGSLFAAFVEFGGQMQAVHGAQEIK